jgi:hypothetical protein
MWRVVQSGADRAWESRHRVYLRTCKVKNRETGEVAGEGLHYLDAARLAALLNQGRTAEGFVREMGESGHTDANDLRAALARW